MRPRVLFGVLALALVGGCDRSTSYEAEVEIVHMTVVQHDDDGKPIALDVEFDYPSCPGRPVEHIRGSAEFAGCLASRKPGERVTAKIEARSAGLGDDGEIVELAGCPRPHDPADEFSFRVVEDCTPIVVNGVAEGFECKRIPSDALLEACPWFARG